MVLVQTEETVRRLLTRYMEEHGYRVMYPDSDTGGVTLEWEVDA